MSRILKKLYQPKQRVEIDVPSESDHLLELDSLLASKVPCKEGVVRQAQVTKVTESFVLVDLNTKSEGRIHIVEFANQVPSVGDVISVFVEKLDSESGGMLVSYSRAAQIQAFPQLEKIYTTQSCVHGKIVSKHNNGYMIFLDEYNITAFCPLAHLNTNDKAEITEMMTNSVPFMILRISKKSSLRLTRKPLPNQTEKSPTGDT